MGWATLANLSAFCGGDLELSIDGKVLGNTMGIKRKFPLNLTPGPHAMTIHLLKAVTVHSGGYDLNLSEEFTVVDTSGADLGPGDSSDELQEGGISALLVKPFE